MLKHFLPLIIIAFTFTSTLQSVSSQTTTRPAAQTTQRSLKLVRSFEAPSAITAVDMSRDGETLITASEGYIQIWDLETGRAITSKVRNSSSHQIKGISIHPGKQAFITLVHDSGKSYINSYNMRGQLSGQGRGSQINELKTEVRYLGGYTIATSYRSKDNKNLCNIVHIDLKLGRVIRQSTFDAINDDSSSCFEVERFYKWANNTKFSAKLPVERRSNIDFSHLAFNTKGRLATLDRSGVEILDLSASNFESNKYLFKQQVSRGMPNFVSAAFSPNGKQLIFGGTDGKVRIWDFENSSQPVSFDAHKSKDSFGDYEAIKFLRFRPDGKTIVSVGGSDHTIKIWEVN
ncbi:MAG: WD40 repeat domain-containing protein [Pseudanabaena sp.]|jgi:WD40 repeat protein|nr:WD40 repeat domain-containing protein [Pseudanabaena sp. M53BS1SP1A06MG]MCA6580995.1 WD40 repeat domain-containing protein [Pseudanabaena sp. M34BS1SP1A06MG]MCA6594312.1 WD40 repeat domain-containing protein [Pseudanabaena sp. M38BS1SP1A06MG]MCA6601648.1 WD40 repeat domain-containing protein [Pseudanabaena sp. M57BS1SP1A06MG]